MLEEHDWDINEAITDPAFAEVMSEDFVDASITVGEYTATNC